MRCGWLAIVCVCLAMGVAASPAIGQPAPFDPAPAWPPTVGGPTPPPTPYVPPPSYFPPADPQPVGSNIVQAVPPSYFEGVGAAPRRFGGMRPDEPNWGFVMFSDIQSWRGIGDRGSRFARPSNNEGGSTGFNFATRLGKITDLTGLRWQVGGSYGVFDWNGRPFNAAALTFSDAQQQIFFTTGFFKRADDNSSWSFGLVHDWMFNQAWGAYAVNPTLGQWRAQVAYALDGCNEIGLWGTLRDKGDTNLDFFGNSVVTRPISQANLFWHHQWEFGANSWLWVGLPENDRLNQFAGGSLGDFLIGGSFIAPLNDALSLYANAEYMHPSAAPGPAADGQASWYVAVGLQFTFGGNARALNVNGNAWLPLLPVANNGNFLVDSMRTF